MKVLVLGGTGSIGRGVVAALLRHGHEPIALARSQDSAERLTRAGATPLRGNLQEIDAWLAAVETVDGVIHAAATWDEDMAATDRRLVETLLPAMASADVPKSFIYTGGTWRYGETGDAIATEFSPTADLDYFADAISVEAKVLAAESVRGMVIHPAMVYEDDGGIFRHMFDDAENLGFVRVIGGEQVRWPLVHHDDLGDLYALMLEHGQSGDVFIGSAIDGVPVGEIARAIAARFNVSDDPIVMSIDDAVQEYGPWAEGYAIDQQVSGHKAMDVLGWSPVHRDVISDIVRQKAVEPN